MPLICCFKKISLCKSSHVTGKLLLSFGSYLSNRRKKVVLPGAFSNWNFIFTGMRQWPILGPLLFLLYINAGVNTFGSNIRLFADDTK